MAITLSSPSLTQQNDQEEYIRDKCIEECNYLLRQLKKGTFYIPWNGVYPLRKNQRKLKVKAIPANLPDYIVADITNLKIGDKLYITELANDAYKFMHPDNTVVCQVRRSRASMNVAEEEETEETEETTEAATSTEETSAQE